MRRPYILLFTGAVLLLSASLSAQAPQPATPAQAAQRPGPAAVTLPRGNVEHGRYIAERVAMCVECHSGRDRQGNILDDQRYLGGAIPVGPPWATDWADRAPRNKGLPGYTDALALRLLTAGAIGRDGAQLRLPMPRFRMTVQDAADVIAFLRSVR
jgi:hypothetical protein